MKTPDESVARKVRQWLAYADEDIRAAVRLLAMPDREEPPYRLIAFHAQQCAEKYLKAYLVCQSVEFPYTHNISTLLELCSDYAGWPLKLRDAEELTDYAVTTRYPGEAAEVTAQEAQRAVELAQQVRNSVKAALGELGMEPD